MDSAAEASIRASGDAGEVVSLGGEARRLLVLAAPIIATMVSRMAMSTVDFVMVSRLGTEATAAVSPATLFVFSVLVLGMGLASSIQTFASQALGRGEPGSASAYAWHGVYIAAVFAAVSYPATLLAGPFWAMVGHPPAVQAMEVVYCRTACWCMGFSVVCASLEGFFNGVQRPTVGLLAILVSLGFNVCANYCLIFGKFGFPAMGIRGAAIATVIAWGVRAAILSMVFLSAEFRTRYRTGESWRFDGAKLAGLVRIGGPTAVQWVLDIGSWFVFLTLLMGAFGTATMAASNIALQYMHFSFMPAIGVGIALTSLVGHAIGEGRPDRAFARARACMWLTGGYMGAIGLVFWLAGGALMGVLSADAEVIRIGTGVLVWAAVFQVFDALGITYSTALRGAGDTRWPAIAVVLHCWVVFIFGGYLVSRMAPGLGYHGPWMMCTLYIILLGLVLRWRFVGGAWRAIDLFRGRTGPAAREVTE
ncbi:MAG: MATE family efflux transporter [Phycisphaerae bacterium]